MKRNEMIVKMMRVHSIRYMMVEDGYITLEQFMSELLAVQEEAGMLAPVTKLSHVGTFDNAWDPKCPT